MSSRSFVYICAVCGGLAAYAGWALGLLLPFESPLLLASCRASLLGMAVAAGLALADAFNKPGPDGLRVAVTCGIGAAGGLIGGLIGEGLRDRLQVEVFVLIGWLFTGMFAGGAAAVADVIAHFRRKELLAGPLDRLFRSAIGGAVGGFLGGTIIVLLNAACRRYVIEDAETFWSPGAWGYVALGVCIGEGVAVAQLVFPEENPPVVKP
jgi:hypothetical protein